MRTLALFDLDGTITRKDMMLAFMAYMHSRAWMYATVAGLLPQLVAAKFGWIDADAPKRMVIRRVFAGKSVVDMQAIAARFTRERFPGMLRGGALACIRQHQANGHEVHIVTASCHLWVEPWCREHGLGLIATGMAMANGRYTGELDTPNCKGAEKVRRIHAAFGDLSGMEIHAYGDTPSDRPMLSLARYPHYQPFR